jgi:hypothetical protein
MLANHNLQNMENLGGAKITLVAVQKELQLIANAILQNQHLHPNLVVT